MDVISSLSKAFMLSCRSEIVWWIFSLLHSWISNLPLRNSVTDTSRTTVYFFHFSMLNPLKYVSNQAIPCFLKVRDCWQSETCTFLFSRKYISCCIHNPAWGISKF